MIQIDQVSKSFGKLVLDRVSFSVPEGCLYGLVGPGAAGKTVLMKIVAGLVRPDAGKVRVAGKSVHELPDSALNELRRNVGMSFQNYALYDFMSVGENIAFPLRRLFDLPEAEVQARVAERLLQMQLPGFENREVRGLSGGQKKRVGVARATITRPGYVLYDEPAAGLDPVTSQRIFELLRREQQEAKATVLMVSSDLERLLPVTDRIGMLHRGRLVFDGTTSEAQACSDPLVHQFLRGLPTGPL